MKAFETKFHSFCALLMEKPQFFTSS